MKPRYFPVYRSPSHSYLRFVLIALPLFCSWLAAETGFSFLYAVAVLMAPVCLSFLVLLCPVLRLDEQGVSLIRLFGKKHHLSWQDIRFHGSVRIRIYGSQTAQELFYISRKPLPSGFTAQGTLPKLTKDFLFATVQPGLAEAIARFLS